MVYAPHLKFASTAETGRCFIGKPMNAQRLLKILALISIAATGASVAQWYETGLAPSPILVNISAGAFIAALLAGLVGQDTRPRMMLRFLAALLALVAVIAFVTDLSRSTEGFTTLTGHLNLLAPSLLAALKTSISQAAGAGVWEIVLSLLSIPTFLGFALLAAICGFASRPHHQLSIYVN